MYRRVGDRARAGWVFLQSDVEEAAAAMRDEFEQWGRPFFRVIDPTPSSLPLADVLPRGPKADWASTWREPGVRLREPSSSDFPASFSAPAAVKPGLATLGQHIEARPSTPGGGDRGDPVLKVEGRDSSAQAATPSRQDSGSSVEGLSVQTSSQKVQTLERRNCGANDGTDAREKGEVQAEEGAGSQLHWAELGWLRDNPLVCEPAAPIDLSS